MSEPSRQAAANSRAFVRSFNVLLKLTRLYGLQHTRSAAQFDVAWSELRECMSASRETGMLLGVSGSQLLLDGEPLETTHAERSFADLLTSAGIASIGFAPNVEREEFTNLVRTFLETGPKAGTLAERLEKSFGADKPTGIRINEIRFVAEDAAYSEAKVAAQLTARTLGADASELQDWFRRPEKMLELIAAAEGSRGGAGGTGFGPGPGGPGAGAGQGSGAGSGPVIGSGLGSGKGSGPGAGGFRPGAGPIAAQQGAGSAANVSASPGSSGPAAGAGPAGESAGGSNGGADAPAVFAALQEGEVFTLLRLLSQLGQATQSKDTSQLDRQLWHDKLAGLPRNAQTVLRQTLAIAAAKSPSAKIDEDMLLKMAEDLAIRFALDRFERGEVRVNAVRQLLDRMGHELETLRKMLREREDRMAKAGLAVESHADLLDRQFWAAVPESGKRAVLTSPEAWCIPPRNVQQYVEELLGRGESEKAADILLKYASCVRNKDPQARKKAAIGLSQLAGLYSKAASQRLQDAVKQIGQQMATEKDPELQTLLSAAFVRLSQECASRRYYRAMQQVLDSLADLEEQRPTWVENLRPRTGIENRLPEFLDEALTCDALPDGFVGVLMRLPEASAEQLAIRLGRVAKRSERESIVEMALEVGGPCKRHLTDILKTEPPAKAATVVGLLSRLDPKSVEEVLPLRLTSGTRVFHDAVVRQLSTAGAPERGRILANSIEALDRAAVPLALDEMGMCGDSELGEKLVAIAEGELLANGPDFLRVKAIEALGRLRAPLAEEHLRRFVEARKTFGWAYAEEIRIAAAQALMKIDPGWMKQFVPHSGLDAQILALAPLDAIPDRDFVRYRRYRRVRLPRSVPVVITSARGKYSSGISVLSLEGGLLSGDIQLAVGTEATLKIPAGIRSISMQAVVRFVRSHQAGFEMVGMGLEDRAKLRRLLVSLGRTSTGTDSDTVPAEPANLS